jgi:hypothetical protein
MPSYVPHLAPLTRPRIQVRGDILDCPSITAGDGRVDALSSVDSVSSVGTEVTPPPAAAHAYKKPPPKALQLKREMSEHVVTRWYRAPEVSAPPHA